MGRPGARNEERGGRSGEIRDTRFEIREGSGADSVQGLGGGLADFGFGVR